MANPTVSIIIVNYCGKNLLKSCLESLLETNYKEYEVIVVDNKSTDDSISFLRKNYPEIQIIELNKNYGFATPNNIAAKTANGKFLVFLNNDTTVTPNWLSELVLAMENDRNITIGQSLLLNPSGTVDSSGDFIGELGIAFSSKEKPKKIKNILSARAACMIIHKNDFLDLGGFDESYFASFEDVELGWKAWLWGYNVAIIPTSIVYHHVGQTVKKFSKTISFHGTKNYVSLLMTHAGFFSTFKILLKIGIFSLFRKQPNKESSQIFSVPSFKTTIHANLWILRNLGKILKKRHQIQSRKIRSNKELQNMGLLYST